MSSAIALVADQETALPEPLSGSKVDAIITVTAGLLNELSFTSDNPLVKAEGTDVTLKPESSKDQPVTYNLVFVAGSGIASFQTPAVKIPLDEARAAYTLNPSSDGKSFSMSYANHLPVKNPPFSISFFIDWNSALQERLRTEDPTIVLEPPNS